MDAWVRFNTDGGNENTALQATSTATPNNTQGAWKEQFFFKTLGEPVPCQTQQA
jgi:hypothetical protein